MERKSAQLQANEFIEQMRGEFDRVMRQVADAVNRAPDGQWIAGSENQVYEAMGEFRRKAYETALQMRVDESEGAFSPGGPRDPEKNEGQGSGVGVNPVPQRMGDSGAKAVSLPRPKRQTRR
jgi:hypothetical protein